MSFLDRGFCIRYLGGESIEELGWLIDSRSAGSLERFLAVESPSDRDHVDAALLAGFDIPDLISDIGDAARSGLFCAERPLDGARLAEEATHMDEIDSDAGTVEDSLYSLLAARREDADPIAAPVQLADDGW